MTTFGIRIILRDGTFKLDWEAHEHHKSIIRTAPTTPGMFKALLFSIAFNLWNVKS